ncbi:hypothetical protein [uncultured Stenotrophomonas sp.]|uniref:hypothetical protein n=1 Tax=uncultured Stenotrophomonas sp. TaxID=165438 RepID=UPI0028E1CE34|nr:hypothetical protein [uncultured Stenotrophomonas sp.]
MERLGNTVSVIHHAYSPQFSAMAEQGRAVPQEVFNASGFQGMPIVPVGEHCVRLTEADYLVSALYQKIAKAGELSTLNADLQTLRRILAGSVGADDSDSDAPQRVSNIYLGKALNILCQLVRRRGEVDCDSTLLLAAARNAILAIRARQDFTLENLSVIMFHLGELINHPKLQTLCGRAITRHLLPIFESKLHELPEHAVTGSCLAFGLVSALRASEHQMVRPLDGVLPRPAADTLLLKVPGLLRTQPDLLVHWESRTLALVAKYGVQYLRRLGQLGRGQCQKVAVDTLQLNAAKALKPIIDEARLPSRGVWDQRDGEFHGFGPEKQLKDYLAYSTHYYCEWLARQQAWVQDLVALQEAARGPLPDNPHNGRNFAEVARTGVIFAPTATATSSPAAGAPAAQVLRLSSAENDVWMPPSELAGFSQAAGRLLRLNEAADRHDREEAVAATNALVVAIVSGRITLDHAARVQMLLDMDGVCMRLHLADPFDAPQYEHQLEGMCAFMSSELSLLVDRMGRPLIGNAVAFKTGLSSWQRTLLNELNKPVGED